MNTNFFNFIARPFTRAATPRTLKPIAPSPWTPMEHMESRTMMSAVPTGTVTFFVDGAARTSAGTTTHSGGANFALCDGSVKF